MVSFGALGRCSGADTMVHALVRSLRHHGVHAPVGLDLARLGSLLAYGLGHLNIGYALDLSSAWGGHC